jgi:general stress protein YciG
MNGPFTTKVRNVMAENQGSSNRGFAAMDEEKQREIASKGGKSVPDEKRPFSKDRELASEAGRKGGESVPDEKRSFAQDRELASEAGRKGGESSGGGNREKKE